MRVLLRRDDGAVAVMIAILMVVLLGVGTFAIDFGVAYASKRQLQTAADAGALAAAQEFSKHPGSCSTLIADTAVSSAARTKGDAVIDSNKIALTNNYARTMSVDCPGNELEVTYDVGGDTTTVLGGIFGADSISTSRTASATVGVASEVRGLRPYFVCGEDLQALQDALAVGTWARLHYPSAGDCANYSGSWYTTNCPLDGNNGTLAANTLNGCSSAVAPVDQTGFTDPSVRDAALVSACTANPQTTSPVRCLVSDPGNVSAQPVVDAWETLLGKDVAIPLFDPDWNTAVNSATPACGSGGNPACFPIKALLAVHVCAYKWGVNKRNSSPDPLCSGINTATGDNDNYLWVRLSSVTYSTVEGFSDCALGSECDGGVHALQLTN